MLIESNHSKKWRLMAFWLALVLLNLHRVQAATATLLFEDDFNRGIPGWTAVQPAGSYLDGPMRWQYDIVSGSFLEQSNIYTDNAAASPSATAVMLINDTATTGAFTYTARLTAGDDDAFGLIFGYQNETNFYRLTFTRQNRTVRGYPWNGWNMDRKVDGVTTNVFGDGTPDFVPSFVNTANRPYDVTIQVNEANQLTLIVVDDVENAPTEYRLVENQPLPTTVAGKVGIFTWGQSGGNPRGFRIGNLNLQPTALTGNPNDLPAWTPVVPPRADGNATLGSGNGGRPIWSLAVGVNGSYGTLHENSDAFGGNDAAGNVDYSAPSIVAGDVNWTNYVVTARIIPADDDGHGIYLRYQNETNFYRIGLRAQDSATGVPRGLSVQKAVNGVFSEVARDLQFIPPNNVPYDISAAINGNELQILVVSNPLGTPQIFAYGPYQITDGTVDSGKIGFFSWGMARTEVDFVRVQSVDGVPLQVSSTYGSPDPAVGLNSFPSGASVTATVESPITDGTGIRRVVTGWTGFGSVPSSGTEASVSFNLTQYSLINWQWRTEYQVQTSASTGGQVLYTDGEWVIAGTNFTVTAQADTGFLFSGWSGAISASSPVLNLTADRPYMLVANFSADSDNDGLSDVWEQAYFGDLSATAAGDPDTDERSNLQEYEMGTNPNFAEQLVFEDGLTSKWINVQRDPILPGQFFVRDFGSGYRGVWEASNDFRGADDGGYIGVSNIVANVSFDGPRLIIRTNIWNPDWTNFTAQAVLAVGDDDGNCVYFRYQDENNWYRVTVVGENNTAAWRAPYGVSVQKRVNGVFSEVANSTAIATDPTDSTNFKQVRITVIADGANFEVRVIGWDTLITPPEYSPAFEAVLNFTDADLATGRFGIGDWGQGTGSTATPLIPVDGGYFLDDITVTVGGTEVFREDWETVALAAELPEGWTNVVAGGVWQISAHGTIVQTSNAGGATTGTAEIPKGDGEGPVLLAPAFEASNYFLEFGIHPFDDDGIGFVYDYRDENNYARVLLAGASSVNGGLPAGLTVSRKTAGTWSDLIVGDTAFVYRVGQPLELEFANNNGAYRLRVREMDNPSVTTQWNWQDVAAAATNRIGLAAWSSPDLHFLYVRAYSLPTDNTGGGELRISGITVEGGNVVLAIENTTGSAYDVQASTNLEEWTTIAPAQNTATWSAPVPSGSEPRFWRLVQQP